MPTDPFIEHCERLCLDFYKVASVIHRSKNYESVARSLDISYNDAIALWDSYWEQYSDS
jgi:hypothetical protein